MSDLISKNQSLVEWKENFKGFVECLDMPRDDYNGIMAYIDEVPSAEKAQLSGEDATKDATSDLISRKKALDVIRTLQTYKLFEGDDMILVDKADVQTELMMLPSAQPEIIRCGQCKYAEAADSEDNQDGYTCQFHRGSIWFSGSYCSWAERREECTP